MASHFIHAIYQCRRFGNLYFRLADGNWYCRFVRSGVDDHPFRDSHWVERVAGSEAARECEAHYQRRLQLLPNLRMHWQPVACALGQEFTDAELLRLDEISGFQGSHMDGFIISK